jgi:hypothetical protein
MKNLYVFLIVQQLDIDEDIHASYKRMNIQNAYLHS